MYFVAFVESIIC